VAALDDIEDGEVEEEEDDEEAEEDSAELAALPEYDSPALPADFYSSSDWLVGFLMGFYQPIQFRWRNSDCGSRFLGFTLMFMGYTQYFDRPFVPTIANSLFLAL